MEDIYCTEYHGSVWDYRNLALIPQSKVVVAKFLLEESALPFVEALLGDKYILG